MEVMESLAREKDSLDELQLAALLGKTLLEQNRELELKLTTLQDFAEETLTANKTLTRRFSETQDSLSLSHRSCDQLEMKVEELEKTNSALLKLCDGRKHTIDQTNVKLCELEDKVEKLEQENSRLRDLECAKINSESSACTVEIDGNCLSSSQLQTVVEELRMKTQKITAQKRALEQEVKRLSTENHTLKTALEQTELAISEMQEKCIIAEEDTQSLDTIASPKTPATSIFSPATFEDQPAITQVKKSFKLPKASEKEGESLFTEIDQQYSTLLKQYEDLLHSCTCSASLAHMKKNETVQALASGHSTAPDLASTDKPFKELFDDMFAALRQTAQVADRLIVRKKES